MFKSGCFLKIKPKILKLKEDTTLIREEHILLTLKNGTLATLILLRKEERGIIFYGAGDYLVDSKIKTHVGTYTKQYTDKFNGWGMIIYSSENWQKIQQYFEETNNFSKDFNDQKDFIEKAETQLAYLTTLDNEQNLQRADWFFKLKGTKNEATLYYKDGKIIFKGNNAKLILTDQETVILKEEKTKLVLKNDHIVLKSPCGKLVMSGEKIVFSLGIVAENKFVSKTLVGKDEETANKIRLEALSLLPRALEDLGYKREA